MLFCFRTRVGHTFAHEPQLIHASESTVKFLGTNWPAAGGFYLRLFGSTYILDCIKKMNKRGYPAMCYAHPWEIFGFPQVRLPLLTKVYGYYRIPCNKLLEHLLKNIKCSPTIDILNDMGIA